MTLNEVMGRVSSLLGEGHLIAIDTFHHLLETARNRLYDFILINNKDALRIVEDITVGEDEANFALPHHSTIIEAYIQNEDADDDEWYKLTVKPYLDTHATHNPGQTGRPLHIFVSPSGNAILWPVPDDTYRIRIHRTQVVEEFIYRQPNDEWFIPPEYEHLFVMYVAYYYCNAHRDNPKLAAQLQFVVSEIQTAQNALRQAWSYYGNDRIRQRKIYPVRRSKWEVNK